MPLAESAQDLVHDATRDVGQSIISAGMAIRQSLVVEAHQMQNCGMKIVNVGGGIRGHSTYRPLLTFPFDFQIVSRHLTAELSFEEFGSVRNSLRIVNSQR